MLDYIARIRHAGDSLYPLGIGGLLIDAYRVQQLMQQDTLLNTGLLDRLLDASLAGLRRYAQSDEWRLPAGHRLAFRELGLAIGLHAVQRMERAMSETGQGGATSERIQLLTQYAPIGETIEAFWREPDNRRAETWIEHQDINEVMLATSLAPDGCLVLAEADRE